VVNDSTASTVTSYEERRFVLRVVYDAWRCCGGLQAIVPEELARGPRNLLPMVGEDRRMLLADFSIRHPPSDIIDMRLIISRYT
jgi:hypothetical protein